MLLYRKTSAFTVLFVLIHDIVTELHCTLATKVCNEWPTYLFTRDCSVVWWLWCSTGSRRCHFQQWHCLVISSSEMIQTNCCISLYFTYHILTGWLGGVVVSVSDLRLNRSRCDSGLYQSGQQLCVHLLAQWGVMLWPVSSRDKHFVAVLGRLFTHRSDCPRKLSLPSPRGR